MRYDLVVRNGTVLLPTGQERCEIGITNGRIAAIGSGLGEAGRVIDAAGKLVLPGGIDSHCHIEEPPSGEVHSADSFTSATASAAAGGTTTVISFAIQAKGDPIAANLRAYAEKARQKALIDHCFHIVIADPNEQAMAELPGLIAEGHRSIKIFMTYDSVFLDDGELLRVMAAARRNGALLTIHAENHAAIKFMTRALEEAGLTRALHHAWAKPIVVEREAVHRAIALAELLDLPIQIFHVSGDEPAREIERAQARGLKVHGETCPQYLFLTIDDLDRPGFEGAKYLCSPALRTSADQEALWQHLRRGVLGIVTSDHAPFRFDDPHGKKVNGTDAPFSRVPNGVPGLETRLPLLFSEGVGKGRIDLRTFAAITAGNPAELFGLADRKGRIAEGLDADLAIWDPEKRLTITNANLHHDMDYTPYEGMQVTGWPVATLSRGEPVWENGAIVGRPGQGRFLKRDPYPFIAPLGRRVVPFDPTRAAS